jgi:hypothetical protein
MTDEPALTPEVTYYQRLLARDQSEAFDLIERHIKANPPETIYDAILVPALNYAERDRLEERLSADQEELVVTGTRELLADVAVATREARATAPAEEAEGAQSAVATEVTPAAKTLSVLAYPASSAADELALHMLAQLLEETPIAIEILSSRTLVSELITAVQERGLPIVCIADLPPTPSSKTRYLIKKLRAAVPDVRIVVGRWAPAALADDDAPMLMEAGATHVASTMLETGNQLRQLGQLDPQSLPDSPAPAKPTLVA